MSFPTLRNIQLPRDSRDQKAWGQLIADIQFNFNLLKNAPLISTSVPSAGEIRFLVIEDDGQWHEWSLLAGNDITFTQDDAARTLTVDLTTGSLGRHWNDI